jgi:hypothetical protein
MSDNTPLLREGRPDSPYYNNQLDAVTESDGSGGYRLKTAGGGGGGGDATAANQSTQIARANNLLFTGSGGNRHTHNWAFITFTFVALAASQTFAANTRAIVAILDAVTYEPLKLAASFTGTTGIGVIEEFKIQALFDAYSSQGFTYDFITTLQNQTLEFAVVEGLNAKTFTNCLAPNGVWIVSAAH